MDSFTDFAFNEEYKRLQSVRDNSGDRPEADVIVMSKMLVLQQWYDLYDSELERKCIDIISFQKFMGIPEYGPDSTTVWSFRKRIIDNATMQRTVRGNPLRIRDILRNKRISVQRVPRKKVYSVVKEVLKAGEVLVTTVERVNLKMSMTDFCFNLHQMKTLEHKGIV